MIFFACVGVVFGYSYLDAKAPFSSSSEIDDTDTEISGPLLLGTIPDWGSVNATVADPQNDTKAPPTAPMVKTVLPPVETVTPPPAPTKNTQQETSRTATNGEKTTQPQRQQQNGAIKPINTPKNTTDAERKPSTSALGTTPTISSPCTESKLTKLSATDAEKLVAPLLRILVGTQDAGQLINTHFNEKVVEMESSLLFNRNELKERLDEYNADYPVRAIKIISAGIYGLRMELNTARIFQNAAGERAIRYGQTQVLIGQGGIIEGIKDSTSDAEFPHSPEFTPIEYKGKKIINNKTK